MIRLALLGLLACLVSLGEGLGVEVEDVTGRQLDAALETENLLAVMFYSKNCKTCDRVLSVLERVGEEVAVNGITLVRVNDKRAAKTHAIRNFPALSLFKMGEALHYEGDLTDAEAILDFLSSPEALDVPGQIEDVTASQLEVLVQHQNFVAVFFYTGNKQSSDVLNNLEKVDDYCEKLEISIVKINDLELVTEYNLGELPALVYYRHSIPILYEGDLTTDDDVLEWLIQNRNSGDEEDIIEEVEFKSLEAMVSAVENIAVLFYNAKSSKMDQILESVETIDDDCDTRGVHFVKIADPAAAYHYGISTLPTLVYFKNGVPNLFDGELLDDEGVLQWLLTHLESAEIEEVSSSMLGRLIRDTRNIVVIFYKRGDRESMEALDLLENVDDDLDRLNVGMVKICETEAFKDWGITASSGVLYFENGIPNMYAGDLSNERELLKWVKKQFEGDDIEDVNSHVMEKIVKGEIGDKETYGEHDDAAILFYKKGDTFSNKVLKALENIDDDCDEHGIIFVKIGDEIKAQSLGINELPALVYFEDNIPNIFTGDLRVERDVLDWLVEQLKSDEIEEVTDEILDNLIEHHPILIAVFCKTNLIDYRL